MTSADADAITALQELLDERQRYEGWLSVLEGRRNSTPRHVYDRVHTDYSLRLERVTERLAERGDQLAGTIDSMTSRLNALRARESERTDARHEAELRALVGEYGPEEWDRLRGAADRELGEIAEQRQGLESEVSELERILALTRNTGPTVGTDDGVRTEGAEASGQFATDAVASAGTQHAGRQLAGRQLDGAVADQGGGQDQQIGAFVPEWPARQDAEPDSDAEPQGDGVPEVPEVDERSTAGQGAPAAQPVAPIAAPSMAATSAPGASTPAPRPVPPPMGDTRRESEKTLKCPECGVMNYATEWYCERCGGELSTF